MTPFNELIIGCWIIFWLYWLISAIGSKKNVAPKLKGFIGIRIVVFVLAVLSFHFLKVQNYSFENRIASNNVVVLSVVFIIFVSGLLLAIWARAHLGKNWGTPMTQKQNPELVTSGPYRYIRHPIYTGVLAAMLATAVVSSTFWLMIFALAVIYFVYSAIAEEKIMMGLFPNDYPAYKRKTKMLIPFVI
jgi:protein-S-isoprenylcysteine O-methyltransferase Ste14